MNCYNAVPQTNIGNSEYRYVMAALELYFGDPRNRITTIYSYNKKKLDALILQIYF